MEQINDFKSKLKSMPNLQEFDMDENLINKVNSDYYDLINFPKIRTTADSFSIFHLNLRSLTAHFHELQLLLSALKLNFDVIGISETKEQSSGFLSNVDLDGYIFYSQCSNTSAGGVGLYVKENLDHMIRYDLSIAEDEFETIWTEIKNAKSQNILCACTYRHPNTDIKKYIEYMDKIMSKISKESKLVFVMGDFNVNLLNYESHNETNDFINTMVSHYLLPHILHPTRPLLWFESYLSNRKQYVSVNGNTSDELMITHGVPQGSVLGPLLFLMFINDLPNVSKHLTFYLFADDTNIYFESSDLSYIQKIANRELRKVRKWLEANRLALNIDKTNFVIFHSQRQRLTEHIVLKIGKKKIKEESYVKFLGIMLDANLSWKTHMAEII